VTPSRRMARACSAAVNRGSAHTASQSCSCTRKISAGHWSSSNRHKTNEHKHAHCHLLSDLVGDAVRHSSLGGAQPGGKRRCHSRHRPRRTCNAPCLAKTRLDDRDRDGHFRNSVFPLFAQSYSLRGPDDDFRPATSLRGCWSPKKRAGLEALLVKLFSPIPDS